MTAALRPTLVMLAGPNGAGKSTLYETRIAPSFAMPFVNADIIQRDEMNIEDTNAAYKSAQIADDRRKIYLTERKSFATETVFSHPSKLELVQRAIDIGYWVLVLHISLEHPDLSVARVDERVKEGGHRVPEEKIRQRYDRNRPSSGRQSC